MQKTSWPDIDVVIHEDQPSLLKMAGRVESIHEKNLTETRQRIATLITARAQVAKRPLTATMQEPNGRTFTIRFYEDGRIEPVEEALPAKEVTLLQEVSDVKEVTRVTESIAVEEALPALDDLPAEYTIKREDLPTHTPEEPASVSNDENRPPQQRQSFLIEERTEEPAHRGWRGALTKAGIRVPPSAEERLERDDMHVVSQHWPGPRTIAIVNGKGGAGKTPTTIALSAVFAHYGGAGVLAWDNNQTRGTLGWRTEKGPHDSTLLELLPQTDRLLSTAAQSADLAHYVHHQTRDRFDVLRSKPIELASEQRISGDDVATIHRVASKYYRIIIIDSGNDESDPMWQKMIEHTDQIVVATTTRDDHAEAGALLLEALAQKNSTTRKLAQNAVAIVTQADPKAQRSDIQRIAHGYESLVRSTAVIPYDSAMVDGLLRYGSLQKNTQRAWLKAAAAVARGFK